MNKENLKNKKKIILICIFVVLAVVYLYFYYKQEVKIHNAGNNLTVESNKEQASQEEAYSEYLSEGLKYKSEGDAGNKDAYYKSIEAYQKATDVSDGKVWIPFLNLGNVYVLVGDFENAEKSYDKALEIAPDSAIYLAKIQLYRYDLKKSEDEIIDIYKEALSKSADNLDLTIKYAAYLRDIGQDEESLKYWKVVSEKFPTDQRYKDEIADLEKKIGSK